MSGDQLAFEPAAPEEDNTGASVARDGTSVLVAAVSAVDACWRDEEAFDITAPEMCVCELRVWCDGATEPALRCCFDWPPLADLALALVRQSTARSAGGTAAPVGLQPVQKPSAAT